MAAPSTAGDARRASRRGLDACRGHRIAALAGYPDSTGPRPEAAVRGHPLTPIEDRAWTPAALGPLRRLAPGPPATARPGATPPGCAARPPPAVSPQRVDKGADLVENPPVVWTRTTVRAGWPVHHRTSGRGRIGARGTRNPRRRPPVHRRTSGASTPTGPSSTAGEPDRPPAVRARSARDRPHRQHPDGDDDEVRRYMD